MAEIPAGTKFQGIIPGNDYKNKKSALLNSLAPIYTIEDIAAASGGGALTVQTLTLQGTDATTTSQAIYGINVIDTATTSNLATRLPAPTTGKQTTFVNTSSMSIPIISLPGNVTARFCKRLRAPAPKSRNIILLTS